MTSGSGPVISVNSWGYSTLPGMAGPLLHTSSASCVFGTATTTPWTAIDPTDGEAGVSTC
jgi:hypothetical protein